MEIDKKSFRKKFPNLAEELEQGISKISMDSVSTNSANAENEQSDKFRNYDPTVIDFLRRCDTENEAESVIMYLEKKGELIAEIAQKLRKQLKQYGVRSFGPKKEEAYYFKASGLC